jgi:hypothetical protein
MASNGEFRQGNGRFKHGHQYAKGNPLARRVQKLRAALLGRVGVGDIRQVVDALLAKAKAGDIVAIRELLNRTVGKPVAPVDLSGPDGGRLGPGLSLADVQLAIVEALADEPGARLKVAQALKELHERQRERPSGDGPGA